MTSSTPRDSREEPSGIRLQKVLAAVGFGSRRKCEVLIDSGRVSVNGELVVEQGRRVDPQADVIRVDGERVGAPSGVAVLAINKPIGVLSAMTDDRGRSCVGDLLRAFDSSLVGFFHVGRLDADTDGLLLLTNDGQLAQLLAHPRHGVFKVYLARVEGEVRPTTMRRLSAGVEIDGKKVDVEKVKLKASSRGSSLVELTIHEGRKHIVRKLLAEVGHPVKELTRTKFGPISLGGLRSGQIREISAADVTKLFDSADREELAPDD